MGQTLSQIEIARRDTLLNKADAEAFDDLAMMYGFPRPSWIRVKNWRTAVRVALYGPRGNFQTLRAFVQAALTQYNIGFRYNYRYQYPPPPPGGSGSPTPGGVPGTNSSVEVTFSDTGWNHSTDTTSLYKTTFHRDVLMQSPVDLKWRTHRLIHWTKKLNWFHLCDHNNIGYWSGFPNSEFSWQKTPVPVGKTTASINTYVNKATSDVQSLGKIDYYTTAGAGMLLPFTITERSSGIHYDYLYDDANINDPNYDQERRMQNDEFIEPNTVRLHLWFDNESLFPFRRPVTYMIVGDRLFTSEGFYPATAVTEGAARKAGQPYGGQLLSNEFSDGKPYGGSDNKLGTANDDKGGGPHPPYLLGDLMELGEESEDNFLLALRKLLPSGNKLIVTKAYGADFKSTYDLDAKKTGIPKGVA